MLYCILPVLLLLIAVIVLGDDASSPIVNIPLGKIQGKLITARNGRKISGFTGIPYAKPPLGPLRFKPPQPILPWTGTLNASQSHAVCLQTLIIIADGEVLGEEDCLFLNVYTPETHFPTARKLPVMVFIHGGGLIFGNSNQGTYGPEYLLTENVVLVTLNYRLGPLGFLSTGDDVVPGNNGLKDQSLALKWAKKYVKYFGGDPNRITLWGQSAGAASVHLHMMSPLSKGLFHRVILDSGAAISPWMLSVDGENRKNSLKLAEMCGCPTSDNVAMVECLRNVDGETPVGKQNEFYVVLSDPLVPFKAVIEHEHEGAMITESPITAIKSGKFTRVPLLAGLNTQEGAIRSPQIFITPGLVEDFNENYNELLQYFLLYNDSALNVNYVNNKVRQFYFDNQDIDYSDDSRTKVTNMFTDSYFLYPVHTMTQLYLRYVKQPIYYYGFGYRGSLSFTSLIDPTYNYGVAHNDELIYLLTSKDLFPTYQPTAEDTNVSKVLVNMWTRFASGNTPTINSKWKRVQSDNLEYYSITSSTNLEMKDKLYWNRYNFWRNLPIYPFYQ